MSEQRVTTLVVEVAGRKAGLDAVLQGLQRELRVTAQGAQGTVGQIEGVGQASGKSSKELLQLAQAAQRVATEQQKTAVAATRVATEEAKAAAAQTRAAAEGAKLAQAQSRVAQAEQQAALAGQRLATESQRTAAAQSRAEQAALRLAQAQERAAKGGGGGGFSQLAEGIGQINGVLGAAGFALGAQQVVAYGAAAIQSANQLEQTTAVMRQLAGSQQRYDQIVSLATANQKLFGGSLNENLVPLNALLQLANRTGAELNTLNQTTQLLLASAPGKSIGDASFGLSEFLSGTGAEAAISLADQFNLNKQALTELAQAGTTAEERLAGLQQLLAQQGVTAETLEARLNTTAATYDRLGASLGNLQIQIGTLLSQGLQPAAVQLTLLADAGTKAAEALGGSGGNPFGAAASGIQQLNQAALQGATSYEQYRANLEQALAGATQFVQSSSLLNSVLGSSAPLVSGLSGVLSPLIGNFFGLSEAEFAAAQAAAQQTAASEQGTAATQNQTAATGEATNALYTAALAKLQDQAASEQNAQAHAALEQAILAAAAAGGSAEAAAARIAAQFNIELAEVLKLINAHIQLASARAGAAGVTEDRAERNGAAARAEIGSMRALEAQQARLAAARKAEAGAARVTAPAVRAGGGGGAGGSAAAAAERQAAQQTRLQNQLTQNEFKEQQQRENAAREHYQKLIDIQADYAAKTLEQQEENQATSRRSKFSFYKELTSAEDIPQTVAQGLSAQYEQAFAEAQQMSQEGKAQLAADYLALKQEQISAELAYQQELAKAREEGDKGEVARLEALAKLRKDAEQAELSNLLGGGDANVTQRDQALAGEDQRYTESQDKIGTAAEQAAQRKILAAQQSGAALAAETTELQRQADLYAKQGKGAAATGTATAAPATPAPTLPTAGPNGGAVATADAAVAALLADAVKALDGLRREMSNLASRPPLTTG